MTKKKKDDIPVGAYVAFFKVLLECFRWLFSGSMNEALNQPHTDNEEENANAEEN